MSESLRPHVLYSLEFSRPEYWSGHLFPSPGNLPNPGFEPRSPALQVDFLSAEPPEKTNNLGGIPNCSSQWLYSTGEHGLWVSILYNLSYNSSTGYYNSFCLSACLFSMNKINERKWKIFCHQVTTFSQKTIDSRAYLNPWLYI